MTSSLKIPAILLAIFSVILFTISLKYLAADFIDHRIPKPQTHEQQATHPIDRLIFAGENRFRYLLSQQTHNVSNAADQYRRRRGRHPPPGFEQWFEFARSRKAVIVEEFFDQIYDDLSPFWGIDASTLRLQVGGYGSRIAVRDHRSRVVADPYTLMDTLESWRDLISSIQDYLPDLDMPINTMDQPRMIASWESLAHYGLMDRSAQHVLKTKEVIWDYSPLPNTEIMKPQSFQPAFLDQVPANFWDIMRSGCSTNSPSRHSYNPSINFTDPPEEFDNYLNILQNGYVSNWPETQDPCIRPELQALHGSFIEPTSISTTHQLFPLFGSSKLSVNNDILIPSAKSWADNSTEESENYTSDWSTKQDTFFWHGAAAGGRNREENWTGFQRHRFVAMMNATMVRQAEENRYRSVNFRLPNYQYYKLQSGLEGQLPDVLEEHTDVGFTHLMCHASDPGDPHCPYTEEYFALKGPGDTQEYANKYLPDLDGDLSSTRFRDLLFSTSLPIKSTVYKEWHDARLVPWAHFVPMDTTFMDIYGIMEYFLGFEELQGHDAAAQRMALNGKRWAERVLRKEDMQIYVYRLLLEYARICDDRRDNLGYVGDVRDIMSRR